MLNSTAEKLLSNILMIGAAFVSIFVISGGVTDPVNVTKLLALGGVCGAGFAIAMSFGVKGIWINYRLTICTLILYFCSVINSVLQSEAPISQLIYGSYGRNTGFITYFLLILIFITALGITQGKSFQKIIYGLLAVGVINSIYCLWVIVFGDFIGWSNPYGNILGTFGNPNFIGAFLGIFVSVLFAFLIQTKIGMIYRIAGWILFLIAAYEIKSSHAIQGIVVAAGGISLVGFFYLRSKSNSNILPTLYSGVILLIGVVSTLGALQIGPMTSIIYKNSVSLRGEYWQAAVNMGNKFPFSGVGMDTFGDWYRRLRDGHALINPGPNIVSNAAHNVILDQYAYGGWPMLALYVAILLLVIRSIIKVTLRQREFDITFVGLAVGWICYQVQSLISINQIGLAIWGWLLGGCLIAYERVKNPANNSGALNSSKITTKNKIRNYQSFAPSPLILGFVGMIFGLLIATPPYSADTKWKAAIGSGNVQTVEKALVPGYLNPQNSARYATATQLFESNKLYELAYKYAKAGVEYNPDSFDAWKLLYYVTNSTPTDKDLAKKNLMRLDPKNSKIFDVPTK